MVDYIRRRHVAEVQAIKAEIVNIPEYIVIQAELDDLKERREALRESLGKNNDLISKAEQEEDYDSLHILNGKAAELKRRIGIIDGIRSGLIKRIRGIIIVHLDELASKDWDFSLVSIKNIHLFNKMFFGSSVDKPLIRHLTNPELGKKPTAFTFSSVALDRGNINGQRRKMVVAADNEKVRYLGKDENGKDTVSIHRARYPHGTLRVQRKTAELLWNVWHELCAYNSGKRVGMKFPLIMVDGQFPLIKPEHIEYRYVEYDQLFREYRELPYNRYCEEGRNKFNLTAKEYNALPSVSLDSEERIIEEKLREEFMANLTEEEYNSWKAKEEMKKRRSDAMKEVHRKRKQEQKAA